MTRRQRRAAQVQRERRAFVLEHRASGRHRVALFAQPRLQVRRSGHETLHALALGGVERAVGEAGQIPLDRGGQ